MIKKTTFYERIRQALDYYKIEPSDLALLIGASSSNINAMLKGKAGVAYEKMIAISKVFGLQYYEFGNPKVEFLDYNLLGQKTREVIAKRRENGKYKRDLTNNLSKKLDVLIDKGDFDIPILASQAFAKMKVTTVGNKSTEVTNLLRKIPRNKVIYALDFKLGNSLVFIHKDFYELFNKMKKEDIVKIIQK